jgi:glycosyltransferase involved in cell wall biosynthesis
MQNPIVTVGIPSYNHAKYLAEAISSVINQTYTNFELIIVDNYSTDGTNEILSKLNDPRISIIKINNRGSIGLSRNIILEKACGEWIAFLDSDDLWTSDKLERCSFYFQDGIDLIYHDLIVLNQKSGSLQNKSIRSRKLKKPILKDLIINGNTIATSSVVVRRSILSKVKGMSESKEMSGIEDFNTWLKISLITDGFKLVSKNLGFYRIHNNNTSHRKNFLPPTAAFIEFMPLLTKKELITMKGNYHFAASRLNFITKNYTTSKKDLISAIKNGSLKNRTKALYMLIALAVNIIKN